MARIIPLSFGIAPNSLLNNKDISLSAKGMYTFMNSKPENWEFSINGLASQLKEGKDKIKATIKELEEFGYLSRKKYNTSDGKWAWEYTLLLADSPSTVSPAMVSPSMVNTPHIVIKNKVKNNKVINTKDNTEAYKELMDMYNQLYEKNTKSYASWKENCDYWLEHYTLIDIKKALFFSRKFGWWAKEPTLDLILRTKNKNGQKVDYIDQLLNSKEAIAFQQPVDPLTAAIRKDLGYDD